MSDWYGFLYFTKRGALSGERYRRFKGATLRDAASKMARFIERQVQWENPQVDYEADVNQNGFADLYKLGDKHPIARYLP